MTIRIIAATLICAGLSAPAFAAPPRQGSVNARQARQAARIAEGVQAGAITPAERARLRAEEAAVRAEERLDRRTGGGLSRVERRDLERDLNRTSRAIERASHN
jgi:hypothetical protein